MKKQKVKNLSYKGNENVIPGVGCLRNLSKPKKPMHSSVFNRDQL